MYLLLFENEETTRQLGVYSTFENAYMIQEKIINDFHMYDEANFQILKLELDDECTEWFYGGSEYEVECSDAEKEAE